MLISSRLNEEPWMRASILLLISTTWAISTLAQQTPGTKGFIGLALADAPGVAGALVGSVKPGGPADRAGVKPGDIILAIDGSVVDRAATMIRIISSMAPNQTARLSIIRKSSLSAQRLMIAVVIESPDGAPGTAAGAAPPNAHPPSNSGSRAPAPTAATAATPSAATSPLTVSGYVRLTDPLEQAFTVDVPAGWRSEGGLARQSALQINLYVRSVSPDKMTYLMIGEPTLPSFSPPSQMGNAIGHREGTLYDAGLGGRALVMRYLPGAEFARTYGQTVLQGLCPSLKFSSAQDRPDLARRAAALLPTVIPSREDGGQAGFTCTHNKQEMEARVEAATRTTRDNLMWGVILLQGFIAPQGQADKAEEILTHIAGSINFSQAWIQKQNSLSQQAAESINRRMQDIFRQERAFIQNLNSVDENFESMDEIISGFSTYHDESTGNNYSLSNTNPNKWIDDNTGRIISTPTNSKPLWGPAYRQLEHVSR
jgi:PDZ domain